MRIGIIGTGTIATAVVRGIAGDGHTFTVSNRSAKNADVLARDFANVRVATNQTVLDQSDVVFLGLMAGAAPAVLSALAFRHDHKVISLMADAPLKTVAEMVAPGTAMAVMLPFPAIAQGGSPILAQGETALLREMFEPRNQVFAMTGADDLSAYLCAQAVLSPVARMIEIAAEWLAPRVSDPAPAEAFLRSLVTSGLAATPAAALLEALNTEGGYNQRLRLHLEQAGMGSALEQGLTLLADVQ